MPVTKTPSNVPAPPIEAISAPRPSNLSRLARSADESAEAAADIGRRRGLSVRMQKDGKERHRLSPILAFFGIDRDWHLERHGGSPRPERGLAVRQTPSGALPAVRGVPIVQRVSMVRGFRKGRGCTRQGEHAHQSQCQDRSRQVGLHGYVSGSKVEEFRVEILALLPRDALPATPL